MDSGYDSDYGCEDFISVPTIQVHARLTYAEYCRKTAHTKTEGKKKEKGWLKGHTVINCRARDLQDCATSKEFASVIKGVTVNGKFCEVTIAWEQRVVVSNIRRFLCDLEEYLGFRS